MRTLVGVICLSFLIACGGPAATPSPTVVPNSGTVRFGSAIDMATLTLVGSEKQTFRQDETLAYVAVLSEPANAASLRLVIAKMNGSTEMVLIDQAVAISNPSAQVVGTSFALTEMMLFLDGPGSYVMRFLRDAVPLASGSFTITP